MAKSLENQQKDRAKIQKLYFSGLKEEKCLIYGSPSIQN